MIVSAEIDERVYNTKGRRDTKFFNKAFFMKYLSLVDKIAATDKDEYSRRLRLVGSLIDGVNFSQNLLFICREDISNMVFLTGLSTFEDHQSYRKLNYQEIFDIFMVDRSKDVPVDDEQIIYTEQSIRENVLCIFADREMAQNPTDRFITSTISSRDNRSSNGHRKMYTWVFFRGNRSDLETRDEFDSIIRLFSNMQGRGYDIVDLNRSSIPSIIMGGTGRTSSGERRSSTPVTSFKRSDSLDDIY